MTIWNPISVGAIDLPHRLAMAPMTRDRSRPDGVPTDLNREYYRQRASMALIITEGTQPSDDSTGLRHAADHAGRRRGVAGVIMRPTKRSEIEPSTRLGVSMIGDESEAADRIVSWAK
jgi:NADH:flavin oxidoreductase / NADH oxidase family